MQTRSPKDPLQRHLDVNVSQSAFPPLWPLGLVKSFIAHKVVRYRFTETGLNPKFSFFKTLAHLSNSK